MPSKPTELNRIYMDFEKAVKPYKTDAACKKGCAYCCTDAGVIDIITLEGLVIQNRLAGLPRSQADQVKKALQKNMKKREQGRASACPFLMKNKACMIYDVRPFACRRIYSLQSCSKESPPVINRQVLALANHAIEALQRLDDNGYTGHISYILYMLEAPRFVSAYLAGDFKPEEIAAFGKTHKIVINRMVADSMGHAIESS